MTRRPIVAAILAVLLVGDPGTAQGEEGQLRKKEVRSLFSLGVEAVTDFPVLAGGGIWAELPGRLRIGSSLGVLPDAYGDVIGGLVSSVGGVDQEIVDLVRSTLDSTVVWRVNLGWRPFADHGAYLDLGYTLAAIRGEADPAELVAATGLAVDTSAVSRTYQLDTNLHLFNVELGWVWSVWSGVTLRAALGAAIAVGSSTTIDPAGATRVTAQETALLVRGAELVDDALGSFVVTPTVSIALGWRLWPL